MRWGASLALFLLLALSAPGLWAQKYRFREYRQDQGLGNMAATVMLQTRDSYLWIGTQNGLFRYDGAKFETFNQNHGLPSAYILGLGESKDGTLWVSTHTGVAHRNGAGFQTDILYQKAADTPGMSLAIAPSGKIFVAQPDGILVGSPSGERNGIVFRNIPLPASARSKPVLQITTDSSSRAWFGCGQGLCRLDPNGELHLHGTDLKIPADRWDGVHIDRKGRLWLRSNQRLLVREARSSSAEALEAPFEPVAKSIPSFDLPMIFEGALGDLFFPSGDGLWILSRHDQTWRHAGPENGLNGELITGILRDHEGGIWISFLGDGVVRWLGYEEWEGWTKSDGLNSNAVWCLRRDSNGLLWAGTDSGINFFDAARGKWISLGGEAGKRLGRVMRFSQERNGSFYAASQLLGIVRIDSRRRAYEVIGKPARQPIQVLYETFLDKDGMLWIGTTSGLFTAQPDKPLLWTPVTVDARSREETIYSVSQDSAGRIWAAGSEGVLWLQEGRWQRFRQGADPKSSLLSNQTWYAVETRPNSVWIGYLGTFGATRVEFKGGEMRFTPFQRSAGLGSNMVYFAGGDSGGRQWFGTDRGIIVADKNRLMQFQDRDGLLWNDCNSNAFFADTDGSVWIGTTKGLAHARLKGSLELAPSHVRVESIRVNGSEVDLAGLAEGKSLRVPPRPNSIEIRFSPLSFRFEGQIEYGVRIGMDDDAWTQGTSSTVNFTSVPAGSARLQARTRNDLMSPWSANLLDVPVEVAAPFWQSNPGRLLALALSLAAIAAFWRFRNHSLIEERARLSRAVKDGTGEIRALLEKAEEANRLKSEFLANMSHEIRTPMNGVLGMLQLIDKTPLNGEQKDYIQLARNSADSLLGLLNEILDLSKAESGHIEIENQPYRPRDLMAQVMGLMDATAGQKGIHLSAECEDSVPEVLLGDQQRLRQILLNLLNNAIKFTDAGFVQLRIAASDGRLRVEVKDSGIGIPAHKFDLIFEAFRQADGSTTRRYGGTGLGLAISKRLVQLMGGEIDVESIVGTGSRFFFHLPLELAAEAGIGMPGIAGMATEAIPATPPLRILLAEDNRVNQVVVLRMLERAGHSVLLATDGAAAAEMAVREPIDVVLMDVHMPVLDGIRATVRIREAESQTGRHIPIAALTAGVLDEERERCLAAGMDAFLPKPIQERELLETLHRFAQAMPQPLPGISA
jgi:signal transduction histidine kinase/CheY-like chemotaxis protein/streptogramin lyase